MKNEIVYRVYDFLKEFPPFSFLGKDDLMKVSSQVTVTYLPEGKTLFNAGEAPQPRFFVVNTGAINLTDEQNQTVDICDEGDVFGIRPLIAHSPYLLSARATEETVLYCIPTAVFLPMVDTQPRIASYLATNFAAGMANMYSVKPDKNLLGQGVFSELITLDSAREPVYCDVSLSIQEGAQIMAKHGIGSLIICDSLKRPAGIVTDKDMRVKVVAGDIRKKENITLIMSSPVICVTPSMSIAELQITMLKNRISHLAVTEDGTPMTKLLGVISEHDLVVQQAENPAIMIKQIRQATDVKTLKNIRNKTSVLIGKYLTQEVSVPFIADIVSQVNDEIIRRTILLAEFKLGKHLYDEISYCWLALGSEGREEQMLLTDQDNAIIYMDNPSVPDIKDRCLALAGEVTGMLHEIGFEYCPADMMASNPMWCQSLKGWQDTFSRWIHQPAEKEIMMCTIFFDFRPVYGDEVLVKELSVSIFENLDKQDIFLHFLAKNALKNPPPLSFFRNFIVEKNGEHKDSFDIKLRAMMPLADAARLLTLSKRISGTTNTFKRYQKMAEAEPQNAELYRLAADAYEILMRQRTLTGLSAGDSGRYIRPDEMDKMARLQLRNAFQPIGELQDLIKVRFQVSSVL